MNLPDPVGVDPIEWAEALVTVGVDQADREGLPCLYCSGAEMVIGERVRGEPHDACLDMVNEYEADRRRLDL